MRKAEVKLYKEKIKNIKKEINLLNISQKKKEYYLDKLKGKKKDLTAYNCFFKCNWD